MAYTTIKKPSDYFNTKLYTGDGTNPRAITGVGFQPDLVWNKPRSAANSHALLDSVRGATKFLSSDVTDAEYTYGNSIQSFDSDGFTCGDNASFNQNGTTYASWNWLASNTTAANTDGSISSTVSASTTSGFSVVSYTGTGSAATVGHGLGVAPAMMIIKKRNSATGSNWMVYHKSISGTGDGHIWLDLANTKSTDINSWNNTAPTSSVFSIGTRSENNGSGDTFIAYCFAEKQGYSKFGSYTGNGNADGTFIYTGFKPAWLLIKETTQIRNWVLYDNKRVGYNPNQYEFLPDTSNTEDTTTTKVDLLSNGFKIKASHTTVNENAQTYIYMAFAEQPLVGDNPATAR